MALHILRYNLGRNCNIKCRKEKKPFIDQFRPRTVAIASAVCSSACKKYVDQVSVLSDYGTPIFRVPTGQGVIQVRSGNSGN